MDIQQLINEWKFRQCLVPRRADAAVTRYDAIELYEYLVTLIDRWYMELIDRADPSIVIPQDITELTEVIDFNRDRCYDGAVISLPDNVVHLHAVTAADWLMPAAIVAPGSQTASLQKSPYLCGSRRGPVAVVYDRQLHVYAGSASIPDKITAFTYQPGVYNLTPKSLTLIPTQFNV